MAVVLLNHSVVKNHVASVHRAGCKDIERDAGAHASVVYEYASVAEALADYVDEEMEEMGYSVQDVKVHGCAKGL